MTFNDDIIYDIINRLPSEGPCIDYKLVPYLKGKKDYAFVKDVIAMLNSEDGAGKDKYIVFGIVDKTHTRKGIDKSLWRDDNEWQDLIATITPKPNVSTGCVEFEGKTFGYIYIPASNNEWVYEAGMTFTGVDEKDQKVKEKTIVAKGQGFSRKGSVNYIITSDDRRRLLSKKIQPMDIIQSIGSETSKRKKILLTLALVGSWSEKDCQDNEIIEKLSGTEFSTYTEEIRNIVEQYPELLKYSNGSWRLADHKAFLLNEAKHIYDDHIKCFFDILHVSTSDLDPKYDLQTENRAFASLYGKRKKYSKLLCYGLAETLAILGNEQELFIKCTPNTIINSIYNFERDFFKTTDWKIYATNADELELLGEACPDVFLYEIERMLNNQDEAFICFLTELEDSFISVRFGYQLQRVIYNIAKDEKYFSRAMAVLMYLTQIRPDFLDIIVKIVLPWFPQTHAPLSARKGIFISMEQEDPEIAWKALMKIMPRATTSTYPLGDPKFMKIEPVPETMTKKELNDAYVEYIHLANELMGSNIERICSMISVMDDVDNTIEEEILSTIKENSKTLNEQDKAVLWNAIQDFLHKHRRYSDSEWALSEERLEPVEEFANALVPDNGALLSIRMFRNDQFSLLEEKGNYEEEEKKRRKKQISILQDIYNQGGVQSVEQFVGKIENVRIAGSCASEVLNADDMRSLISASPDICCDGFLQSLIRWTPFEKIQEIMKELPNVVVAKVISILPISDQIIHIVANLDEASQDVYWNNVDVWGWSRKDFTSIEKVVRNLNKRNRIGMSLSILHDYIHNSDNEIRPGLVAETLLLFDGKTIPNDMNVYDMQELIKWLQNKNTIRDEMLLIEWKYIALLRENEGYSPEVQYDELSSNPDHFIYILKILSGKERKPEWTDNTVSQLVQHCYELLQGWKRVPGLDDSGTIDEKKLEDWFSVVAEQSAEIGIEKQAMFYFGRTLFYAPADKDGFFIDKRVAQYLQRDKEGSILSGYHSEAFSYRGVHAVDPTGQTEFSIQKRFEEKAREAEERGMFRFAGTLRDVAKAYYDEGMRNKGV